MSTSEDAHLDIITSIVSSVALKLINKNVMPTHFNHILLRRINFSNIGKVSYRSKPLFFSNLNATIVQKRSLMSNFNAIRVPKLSLMSNLNAIIVQKHSLMSNLNAIIVQKHALSQTSTL